MKPYQFKPQNSSSLRHKVAEDIRDAIITGNLTPGSKLRESEIAGQMGISRGPVREAIRDLEAMGLVVSLPYKETVVADVSKEEVTDLLIPIRLQLEIYALKMNFSRYNEDFFSTMEAILAQMRAKAAMKDLFGVVEEDIRFHEAILKTNESSFPLQIWNSIVNRLRLHFIKNTRYLPDLNKVAEDHKTLLDSLRTRDYNQAEKLWVDHIKNDDSLLCFHFNGPIV